ncbi:MAG TPA: phage tail tape measure protein, partial [Candidatus Merdenecus merdavium]|nr:phage tail tape measure protein [Candidatus Merdenecus merdavium]
FKKMPGKIKNGIITKWNEVTGSIHDAFVRPFKNIVEAIKRTFNFTLPRPKLPRININWRNVGMGISIPSFGIQWYKKGAIFTKPTMFNTPFGMKGVGEAGAEAVLPIEKLSDIFVDTMAKLEGGTGGDIYISGNEFIVRDDNDIEKIARELQKMIDRKRRGVGL